MIGMGIACIASVGIVVGAKLVCDGIADGIKKQAEDVYNSVHNEEVDEKLALLAEKEQILSNINDYSVNIAEADRLSDFMPEGNSEVRAKLVEALESVEPNANLMGDINISEYEVTIEVRCYDIETPTKYVRALIDQDYFTDIIYVGFAGEKIEESDENKGLKVEEKAGDYRYSFALSMRIRGGNGYEIK